MTKIIKVGLSVMLLSIVLVFAPATAELLATTDNPSGWLDTVRNGGLDVVGTAYGTSDTKDVRMIVVDVIKVILGFLGIIAVIIVFYAGYKWMMSGGNEETVSDTKKMLVAGLIGLVIILSAYILANFVIDQIYSATTGIPVSS